jgi:hypothetical protein
MTYDLSGRWLAKSLTSGDKTNLTFDVDNLYQYETTVHGSVPTVTIAYALSSFSAPMLPFS